MRERGKGRQKKKRKDNTQVEKKITPLVIIWLTKAKPKQGN